MEPASLVRWWPPSDSREAFSDSRGVCLGRLMEAEAPSDSHGVCVGRLSGGSEPRIHTGWESGWPIGLDGTRPGVDGLSRRRLHIPRESGGIRGGAGATFTRGVNPVPRALDFGRSRLAGPCVARDLYPGVPSCSLLLASCCRCHSYTPGSQSFPNVADGPMRGSSEGRPSRKACTYARSSSIRART